MNTATKESSLRQNLSQKYQCYLPSIKKVLEDPFDISDAGAKQLLKDVQSQFDRSRHKGVLVKKRIELQGFEKQKDYEAALKSLGEKSAMLQSFKIVKAKDAPNHAEERVIKTKIEKRESLPNTASGHTGPLSSEHTFFDAEEDWL